MSKHMSLIFQSPTTSPPHGVPVEQEPDLPVLSDEPPQEQTRQEHTSNPTANTALERMIRPTKALPPELEPYLARLAQVNRLVCRACRSGTRAAKTARVP